MKCFYHSADLDGQCSGAIIKMMYPKCELIGINYGDGFPWDSLTEGEKVFMVDFSLQPEKQMVALWNKVDLVWIDHHKSSLEGVSDAFDGDAECVSGLRKNGIGACQLTWEHLYPLQPPPTFIKLLAQYDVWDHSDPRTLSFQYGMRLRDTNPTNLEPWHSLFDVEMVQRITEDGGIILSYQKQENEKYCDACSFETELDGLRCVAINKMLSNSQLFGSAWDPERYDAMLAFGWRNGSWTVSLYSTRDDVDVSIIAKNRGGGGHKGAAGFQCENLPFNLGKHNA